VMLLEYFRNFPGNSQRGMPGLGYLSSALEEWEGSEEAYEV
jgi:hypothetical protein